MKIKSSVQRLVRGPVKLAIPDPPDFLLLMVDENLEPTEEKFPSRVQRELQAAIRRGLIPFSVYLVWRTPEDVRFGKFEELEQEELPLDLEKLFSESFPLS